MIWTDWLFLAGLGLMALAGSALLAHAIWTTYQEEDDD